MTTTMSNYDYPFDNVVDALRYAANQTTEGISAYPANDTSNPHAALKLSYAELLNLAEVNASKCKQKGFCKPGSVVLVHFDNALDSIIWYWSVLLSGAIPSVTGPGMFSQSALDRKKHLSHLQSTFNRPLCLTRRSLMNPFLEDASEERIDICTVEELDSVVLTNSTPMTPSPEPSPSSIAAVMLTSGSSGNAKAVPLTHRQLLAAFKGKRDSANLQHPESPFLSWTHMDHVANLVHCHLFAIVSCVSQIQVAAADILLNPVQLLNLASRHHVSRIFAPNFLLAKILRLFKSGTASALDSDLNLEALYIDTGGEANVTEVCVGLQSVLSRYGAPPDVFKPSFGMTETCAGCIVNDKCPSYDSSQRLGFTSLGEPMPGVQMRIARLDNPGTEVARGERGSLEITGDAIFKGYYNNPTATAEAFTSDGWFRTGDNAYMDEKGQLHLDGRTKEMININGVKYLPHELDSALEQAEIPGTTPSYFCCFAMRDTSKADTEVVVVLYLPSYKDDDDEARYEAQSSIIRTCSMHTHSRPLVVPLRVQDMPKSTLGKLSRTKLKAALEEGVFADQKATNDEAIARYRQKVRGQPETIEEAAILYIISQQLEMGFEDDFSVNDSIFSTGATSMDLVAIMQRLNGFLRSSGHEKLIRLTDILKNPTARGIASRVAVSTGRKKHEYDPVVTLQPHGTKTPLWLVHPGVGEVLVFVNLAHHITDRPIHAFRARGFNASEGETPFNSLTEVFETYRSAIKKRQPTGPYAIAGYSFGGMVAFEVTKLLEAGGDEVRLCGSWNLPPHIKFRMRELLWDECVIHLFYFVGLMDEAAAYTHKPALCAFEREGRRLDAIRYLKMYSDPVRWDELGLDEEYYLLWVGLASNMQGLAVDYEPEGSVANMDVFVADPLSHVAKNREDWVKNRLAAWESFVRTDVRFHHVEGAHYTMLNPEYVVNFAKTLRKVLRERGL
ncbi:acetyl-CoA synthetase-like protein [Annulohypoxylon maeteangense]|uniref:acetyl-CoA synthetase-like protein n=1 Tax=Annulohypoxylon maeteangense TaxID=1927788 RepID=UPI002008A261|nr:acetyl-CoA synthetase-like protein [Annulohypoxylon maeteangense]KAI0885913.1 acetyl-CoA synthetase-like protein [Annulohypoxylon maeteangense]